VLGLRTLGPLLLTAVEAQRLNDRDEERALQLLRFSKQRVDGGKGRLSDQDMRKIMFLASGQRYQEGFSIQYRNPYSGNITRIPGRFKWRNGRWEVDMSNGIFYIHPAIYNGGYEIRNTVTGNVYRGSMFYFSSTEITAAS